jgi:hypothetical protein
MRRLTSSSARWFLALAAGVIVSQAVTSAWHWGWSKLTTSLTPVEFVLLLIACLALLAVLLAATLGQLSVSRSSPVLTLRYAVAVCPYFVRDLAAGRKISRGTANARFKSLDEFTTDDPRRAEKYQVDFGVGWPDGQRIVGRVTWLKATGELIAASGRGDDGDGVEVLGRIASEREVDQRLKDWEYVGAGRRNGGLPWVRCRAHGWMVPIPPNAARWRLEESDPPSAWPSPPPATVGRSEGAYLGAKGNPRNSVEIAEPARDRLPLYHYVDSSPTGFAWGYGGAGPTDLARSLLADRLGYVPSATVYVDFRDEVVARLGESFTLTFAEVDDWIDRHGNLFATDPRAEVFDPFAAGGAH